MSRNQRWIRISLAPISSNWWHDEHLKINQRIFEFSRMFTYPMANTWKHSRSRKNLYIQADINSDSQVTKWLDTIGRIRKKRKYKQKHLPCALGRHKEAERVLGFQVAILQKFSLRSLSVTQFDALFTGNVFYDRVIWRKSVKNFIFKEVLPSPLCNRTIIFQIYTSSHFTTLIEDDQYYFYGSIRKDAPIPEVVPKIHSNLVRG